MESDTLLIISTQICMVAILMENHLLLTFSIIGFLLYGVKTTIEIKIQKKSIEHLKNINEKWGKKK